jgi:Domain of Unknown Function (DUF1206)
MTTNVAQIRRSRGYHVLVGVGLVSYGLVYLVLAWLTLQIALGGRGDASPEGALQQLTRQPLGTVLLWVMAIGLFACVVWQVMEATIGREESGRDGRMRRRLTSAGRAAVYLALGLLAVGIAMGGGGGSGNSEQTLADRLMALPFGRFLVGAVGVAVIAVGIRKIVKGVKQKFVEDLDSGVGPGIRRLGTVGYCANGVALAIVGGLFGYAALTYDPEKAGGLDAALDTIRSQPFGTALLVVMALGFASFGVYCFFWARKARY